MPTIIDSLLVELGIDGSKFRSDADRTQAQINQVGRTAVASGKSLEDSLQRSQNATDRRLRQTAEVGRVSAQQFSKFKVEVAALFATLATGFGLQTFIKNLAAADANTGRLATRLGMSTKDLASWQEASKRTGGSAEATGSAFAALSADFQNWKMTGQSEMLPWLQTMGIAWETAEGKMRPMGDIYKDIAGKFQNMSAPQANALGAHFAMDPGLVALLQKGPAGVQALLDEMQKLGVVTAEQAAAAQKFENSLADIQQRATDLGRTIFNDLAPAIDAAIKRVGAWYDANKKWLEATIDVGLKEIVEDVKIFAGEADKIADAMGGWTQATEVLFALWLGGKFLKVAANLASVLRLLALVPGSGVSMAALGPELALLGLGGAVAGGFKGAEQSGEEVARQGQAGQVPTGFDEFGHALGYRQATPEEMSGGKPGTIGDVWRHFVDTMRGILPSGSASDERKTDVRDKLSRDLGISTDAASGLVSNLNAESGIAGINEVNPAPGTRGGFGWAQWTGSRRDDFEQWSRAHGLDVRTDDANSGFLIHELTTKYPQVLAQLKRGDITPSQAAEIVARQYIVPPSDKVAGHVAGADAIARLSSAPPESARNIVNLPKISYAPDPALGALLRQPAGAAHLAMAGRPASNTTDNSTDVTVNGMTIVTQARDADGIARAITDRLRNSMATVPADRGLA